MSIKCRDYEQRYQRVAQIIKEYVRKNQIAPTIRELANEIGVSSVSTMHIILEHMEKRGLISWQHDKQRTIVVLI